MPRIAYVDGWRLQINARRMVDARAQAQWWLDNGRPEPKVSWGIISADKVEDVGDTNHEA